MKLNVTGPALSIGERNFYEPGAATHVAKAGSHHEFSSAMSTSLHDRVPRRDGGADGSGERGLPKIAVGVLYDIRHLGDPGYLVGSQVSDQKLDGLSV